MVINNNICCGRHANGPSAPEYIDVRPNPDPGPETRTYFSVLAVFKKDSTLEKSTPTCSENFSWVGFEFMLHFTEDFELVTPNNEKQHFKGTFGCPSQSGLQPTTNPYYIPKSPKQVGDPNKQSNAGAEDSIYQPIGSFPWMGSASSVANANVDLNDEADTNPADLITSSNSSPAKFSSPNSAPLPGEMASTIGADLNLAGSNGDDCTGYGCGVASFMQWNPSTSKRGMPVEFRA
ncbi:hypothetical protein MMC07_004025 [Pseudocyphellaria aurata]|nr:hypothetical protein [Pseudocyphellaria aurata]